MAETVTSPDSVYELELPNGYVLEENEEAVTVYNMQSGSGAINITSYGIPEDYAFDIGSELGDFIASIDGNVSSQSMQKRNDSAYCEFAVQGRFWKTWVLYRNHKAVFVSYNCDEEEKNREADKVDEIMASLRIVQPNAAQ